MDLYGPADLSRARDEGVTHGRQLERARAATASNVLLFLGVTIVIVAVVVVTLFVLNRPPRPSFEFVQIGGQTCVRVENPDYSMHNELPSPMNLVFCEDMR